MNTKDYIKKGSLVTLSATVLFSQSAVFAEEYKLNNSVQVYDQAINAKNRINSIKTFPKGKYYILKKEYGMLNISTKENDEGLWINPKDNIELNINNLYEEVNIGEDYILSEEVSGYINSYDAKSRENVVTRVYPAKYKVYNKFNGMVNITLEEGQPGVWINPNDLSNSDNVLNNVDKINIDKALEGYMNSDDANNLENSVIIVEPGNYYIYRSYNGMINVTMVKDEPGAWINPKNIKETNNKKKTFVKSEKIKYDDSENQRGDYLLREKTNAYSSLNDAKSQINSVEKLEKGRYFISKSSDGMINLSKNKDDEGVWINPKGNLNRAKTTNFINEAVKMANVDNKLENVVVKQIENKVSENKIKDSNSDNKVVLEKTDDKVVESQNEILKIEDNKDSKSRLNEDKVDSGFDKSNKMIISNDDKMNKEKEVLKEDVENDELESKNTEYKSHGKDNIFNTNKEYDTKNIENKTRGKLEDSHIEIKIVEPQVNILDEENVSEKLELTKGQKFVLDKATEGYIRAEDALLKVNSVNTVQPGEYFVYKTNSGMINITKEENNSGMWINPR